MAVADIFSHFFAVSTSRDDRTAFGRYRNQDYRPGRPDAGIEPAGIRTAKANHRVARVMCRIGAPPGRVRWPRSLCPGKAPALLKEAAIRVQRRGSLPPPWPAAAAPPASQSERQPGREG